MAGSAVLYLSCSRIVWGGTIANPAMLFPETTSRTGRSVLMLFPTNVIVLTQGAM